MKILVTGGAGFIGSHIVDRFITDGHSVVVLDDLSYGSKENIHQSAEFVEADIRSKEAHDLILEGKFDLILHAAAQKSVGYSVEEPIFDADVNILGTINLLEAAVKGSVPHFIFVSTGGAIYGDAKAIPTDEYAFAQPLSPYAASKYSTEVYLDYYAHQYGLHTVSMRLANVYGPRQDPKGEAGVIAIFITQLLKGEKIFINGDGMQTRDYVHVLDVALAAKEIVDTITTVRGGIYNVGTGKQSSVLDLVQFVSAAVGNTDQPDVEHRSAVPGEVRHSALNTSKLSEAIGWQPHIQLQDGIAATVEWFKKQ